MELGHGYVEYHLGSNGKVYGVNAWCYVKIAFICVYCVYKLKIHLKLKAISLLK